MMIVHAFSAVVSSLLHTAPHQHLAQGCIDSPECPTALLALVGTTAAAIFSRLSRAR